MKVGDLVKRKRFSRKRRFHTTIYVITEVYRSSVFNNSYTLFTISQASENLRVYKKDLILLEDTL
jgi:hypothetical protein